MADGSSRQTYGAHPDAIARRRLMSQRAAVTAALDLAMVKSYAPLKAGRPTKKAGNPNPNTRSVVRVCQACLYPYPQSKGFFSDHRVKVCLKCAKRKRERAAFLKKWIAERKARKAAECTATP